jgi:membrane-bound serine protease (ClpP class)
MLLGSMMLFDAPETGGLLRVSWFVIVPAVASTAGLVIVGLSFGMRALYRKPTTGVSGMVGEIAVARTPLAPEGQVLVQGELWGAIAQNGPVAVGEKVEVVGVNGLTLTVVKAADRR